MPSAGGASAGRSRPHRRGERRGCSLSLNATKTRGRFNETLKRVAKAPVKEKPLDALKPDLSDHSCSYRQVP